jgi:hypothetical protein
MAAELSNREIVTEPCRLSFPALFEPKPVSKTKPNELKYQAAILIPKSVSLKPFYDCVKAAMIEKFGKAIKLPARANPIKACDEKELAGYEEGWHYINAKSGYQPGVVNQKLQDIIDPTAIYAGCWCRFHLLAFGWDHPEGGKGVSFSLQSVQFIRDDDRLDGRLAAKDAFDAVEVEGDDEPENNVDVDELFG